MFFYFLLFIDRSFYCLDIVTCKIKYEEGFASIFGHIFTKPESMWTQADKELVIPTGSKININHREIDNYITKKNNT